MYYSVIGLLLDVLGVILLFIYGIPPKDIMQGFIMDNSVNDNKIKKNYTWSKIGLMCLVFGFVFQIIGTIITNN